MRNKSFDCDVVLENCAWYLYGRSQAINMSGFRLLMPYIADTPTFMLSDIDGLLYYNGFAIVSNDLQQLERLKKILNTDIFWFYVKNISKPYANGYYSMGKRYIRYFGIPDFSEEQLNELDALTKKEDIYIERSCMNLFQQIVFKIQLILF